MIQTHACIILAVYTGHIATHASDLPIVPTIYWSQIFINLAIAVIVDAVAHFRRRHAGNWAASPMMRDAFPYFIFMRRIERAITVVATARPMRVHGIVEEAVWWVAYYFRCTLSKWVKPV
jgi:hypothetical protein